MFVRRKKSGKRVYLQIVENSWDAGKTRQRVIATIGRVDLLKHTGKLEGLVRSCARFCEKLGVLDSIRGAKETSSETITIGPGLVFERLWRETGIKQVLEDMLHSRRYEFSVERAIFVTVLHRLFSSGSDRAAEKWKKRYQIAGAKELELHHLYRAMAWLGEELPAAEQGEAASLSPRCIKDRIEEHLFLRRQDLFSGLDVVFFDTTSIYFEGEGGATLGQRGNSKAHRPDLKQMVVGVVLDGAGNPVCSEMWPGNTADVKTLLVHVNRLRKRFGIRDVCIVADRGMISNETIQGIEEQQLGYILGTRMRKYKEVKEQVLGRGGRFQEVYPERSTSKDPSPLQVKEVWVDDRRYIVCLNKEQARKDAADREAIVASLRDKLKQGDKSFLPARCAQAGVGNKGYRRYLKVGNNHFSIDDQRIREESRFDGKWVLRTNRDYPAQEVALKYKQLWMVEDIFRTMKSILETRPIYHKCDETIRGHVFCSFLALILRKELQDRLEARGWIDVEWADVIRDLDELHETEVQISSKRFILREQCPGVSGKAIQAAGASVPPTIRQVKS